MDDAFRSKIIRDLDSSGFSSEMRTGKALLDAGWVVSSGASYFDKDCNRNREYDVDASYTVPMPRELVDIVNVGVRFLIDVKKSNRPWVVFKAPIRSDHSQVMGGSIRSLYIENGPAQHHSVYNTFRDPVRDRHGWLGYGVHESFKNPTARSRWYSAFVTTFKAATHTLELEKAFLASLENSGDFTAGFDPDWPHFVTVHRSLVVLDGLMISAELDASGEVRIEEVSTASFDFEHRSAAYQSGLQRLDVVTLPGLTEYLGDWKAQLSLFAEQIVDWRTEAIDD